MASDDIDLNSSNERLLQLQRDALKLFDLEELCTQYVFTRPGAYIIGICCCVLLPTFVTETTESRCAYAVCTLLLLVSCEVLPSEAAALMPALLLPVLGLSFYVQQYLAPPVLTELASTAIMLCVERSSLLTRPVLWFLRVCGTRYRCLMALVVSMSAVSSLTLLDSSTTVLILAAIVEASMRALQDEAVQAFHQRSLFDKATRRLPVFRKMQLQEVLWPNRDEESPPSGTLSPVSLSAVTRTGLCDTPTPGSSSEDDLWSGLMYTADKVHQPPRPLYSPPPEPLPPPQRSALRDPSTKRRLSMAQRTPHPIIKKTAFIAGGEVILPGQSSPPAKVRLRGEDILYRPSLQALMKQGIMADVMFWDSKRYHTMYCNLLSSAALVSVVTSIPALHTNRANRYFVSYFRTRFEEDVVSSLTWLTLLTPVIIISALVIWVYLSWTAMFYFDAANDAGSVRGINVALRDQEDRLGRPRPLACFLFLLFLLWLGGRTTMFADSQHEISGHERLPLDYTIVIVMLVLSEPSNPSSTVDETSTRMPWGALLIYGGSMCMASVIKESSVVPWMMKKIPNVGQHRMATQLILALGAAVLTELLSNEDTLAVFLPVAVDIAVTIPCNPLYFAIPVTVASSTSFLLPMSSFTIAYVYDRLDITPWDLFVCGVILKCLVVVMTLLIVATLGNVAFHWNRVPSWVGKELFNVTGY